MIDNLKIGGKHSSLFCSLTLLRIVSRRAINLLWTTWNFLSFPKGISFVMQSRIFWSLEQIFKKEQTVLLIASINLLLMVLVKLHYNDDCNLIEAHGTVLCKYQFLCVLYITYFKVISIFVVPVFLYGAIVKEKESPPLIHTGPWPRLISNFLKGIKELMWDNHNNHGLCVKLLVWYSSFTICSCREFRWSNSTRNDQRETRWTNFNAEKVTKRIKMTHTRKVIIVIS